GAPSRRSGPGVDSRGEVGPPGPNNQNVAASSIQSQPSYAQAASQNARGRFDLSRYLPTAEELKNYQVLRVSNVPPFEDAFRLRDLLKPLFEPYGEILEIEPVFFQNFTVKIKTGEYLVNFKLADLDKPVPNSLKCTARNSTFPLTVRLDGNTNPDGCYFCHSPRHSRAHFWARCPQRKEQHPREAKPQARSHTHREFTTVSPRPPPPETTVSKPRWNLGPIPTLSAFTASLERAGPDPVTPTPARCGRSPNKRRASPATRAQTSSPTKSRKLLVPRGHTKTTRSISTPSRASVPTLEPPLTSLQNASQTVSSQATYADNNELSTSMETDPAKPSDTGFGEMSTF
ncbi:hypothetical protein V1514DRAFT_339894, partial [Lipomyces japonicus]|uniref:uncharacterized protein n=1 Tax=Lipomyces japonicus TaxID=56871 RepID=UPI0034CD509E